MIDFGEAFKADNPPDSAKLTIEAEILRQIDSLSPGFQEFVERHSGQSFDGGLYRVHSAAKMASWTALSVEAFPDMSGKVVCFGSDWLGRIFALDINRRSDSGCLCLMLDMATGEALEIPTTFLDLHREELVNHRKEALASEFFEDWQRASGGKPKLDQCVGYKVPLFLGGSDTIENLELTDMEVYWGFSAQLIRKVRALPPGTPVGRITID